MGESSELITNMSTELVSWNRKSRHQVGWSSESTLGKACNPDEEVVAGLGPDKRSGGLVVLVAELLNRLLQLADAATRTALALAFAEETEPPFEPIKP